VSETEALRQRVLTRLDEQRQLVQSLLALREQLPGSLIRLCASGAPSCLSYSAFQK